MMSERRSDSFQVFRRQQSPAVFELALRHSADRGTALACVDTVFDELAGRWDRIADPVRFIRRAAVLYVCRSRTRAHRVTRHVVGHRRRAALTSA